MNNLKELYEQNKHLVTLKESTTHPGLFVIKYRREVFYKSLWSPFLEECRGLVVDKDFNIITRPFLKIYNYGVEKEAPIFDLKEKVQVFRKVNGFMLAATYYNDELIASTTGSLDSDFVKIGYDYLNRAPLFLKEMQKMPEFTFIFECCDPSDPHIVEEEKGLYFIGLRSKKKGVLHTGTVRCVNLGMAMAPTKYWGLKPVEYFESTVEELLENVKTVKHEGFVFYNEQGTGAKIKSPYYLTKKALMRKNIDKLMAMDAKKFLDEEFYGVYDLICKTTNWRTYTESEKKKFIEDYFVRQLSP